MVGTAHGDDPGFPCQCKDSGCRCSTVIYMNLYDGICSYCKYGMHVSKDGKDLD